MSQLHCASIDFDVLPKKMMQILVMLLAEIFLCHVHASLCSELQVINMPSRTLLGKR